MSGKERLVIANCGGFWGDDPTAAKRQVEGGPIDYLVMDYLAEVTMAILQKQRAKNPEAGFATDFVKQLEDVLPTCVEKGITVISNAGGVNPMACRRAVEGLALRLGIADKVKVGVVLGDDLYGDLDELLEKEEPLAHMETGEPLSEVRDKVLSANVYLGARGVVRALAMGANVVISGRVTDTGVTLAPMIHEFGWASDDWDRLAAGIVAGHIIECGTQCTGGNFTDWRTVPSYRNMGYPLVEAYPDGSFVVTKHPNTGGLVNVHTVSEQLLYEMGAPEYLAPDCTARFDTIQLAPDGPDRVKVTGVRGGPPPEKLKVSISFEQGYRAFGRLMVSGPEALEKAQLVADTFWASVGGTEAFEGASTQLIGYDSCHPALGGEPGEVLIQLAVRDQDRGKIESTFATQLVPKVLGTVPGITYLADQGRPRASGVVGYWPALISRDKVRVTSTVGDETIRLAHEKLEAPRALEVAPAQVEAPAPTGSTVKVPLSKLCLARSGDKGDTCNVGVIARSPAIYLWVKEHLTAAFVKERFQSVCRGEVERFEVPNLLAMNFLLHHSLGGGGTLSLLLDAQGKTYAQFLLAAEVEVPQGLVPA
ncbi:MAG: acyclic terpene utilization AtuA family protein [Planctomycetota bacterium]